MRYKAHGSLDRKKRKKLQEEQGPLQNKAQDRVQHSLSLTLIDPPHRRSLDTLPQNLNGTFSRLVSTYASTFSSVGKEVG